MTNFLSIVETNEIIRFDYNGNFFPNKDIALGNFLNIQDVLLEYLKGFKEKDVRKTVEDALNDSHLCARRAKGRNLFSCNYDADITIDIHKDNIFLKKGSSVWSHYLIKDTPFLNNDREWNLKKHSEEYKSTEYIISGFLHFITYPNGEQEIVDFD